MNKLEIVVTARPSWARVKSLVLSYANICGNEMVKVVLTGSAISRNFGDISSQVPEGIKFVCLPTLQESDDLSSVSLSAFNLATSLSRAWAIDRPDAVLVIADRTETLGASAAAAICQIPIIHLQGGEISGSIDNKIRGANSKLADLHLTTNSESQQRLIEMGEPRELIHIVGCPSLDLVKEVYETKSSIDFIDLPGVGFEFSATEDFGIVMFHPDTLKEPDNIAWLNAIVNFIQRTDLNWVWFWPNADFGTLKISKELRRLREARKLEKVRFIINLKPESFIALALRASLIIGNSSFGIREASFIGLPAINLGSRQINRQKSSNVLNIENVAEAHLMDNIFSDQFRGSFGVDKTYGNGVSGRLAAEVINSWHPRLKSY